MDPKQKNSIHLKWIFLTGVSQMSRVPTVWSKLSSETCRGENLPVVSKIWIGSGAHSNSMLQQSCCQEYESWNFTGLDQLKNMKPFNASSKCAHVAN